MAKDGKQFRDPESIDPAKRAAASLSAAVDEIFETGDVTIVSEKVEEQKAKFLEQKQREKVQEAEEAHVTEAMAERKAAPVVEFVSERNRARLLILTCNTNVFEERSSAAQNLLELSNMFEEVHVIVLTTDAKRRPESKRVGGYVWVYAAESKWWWKTILEALRVAKKQLVFGGGFRPDLIIAEEPFEAGLAGKILAERYGRSFQVHVTKNFLDASFARKEANNQWRVRIAKYVLKRAGCIRTQSEFMRRRIIERFKKPETTVEMLPVFHNLSAWQSAMPTVDLTQKYPQFKFILLHASTMNKLSYTTAVIDGLFYLLRQYPTIGLIIVGDGPRRGELVQLVEKYGLQQQIIFEANPSDLLSYIKTAQVVVHTSEETSEDHVILKAAVVETPMICGNQGLASELFIDGESVLLCPVDSPPCFGEKVNQLLNDNHLRRSLALSAKEEVFSRIEQDYTAYMESYRGSIERCITVE